MKTNSVERRGAGAVLFRVRRLTSLTAGGVCESHRRPFPSHRPLGAPQLPQAPARADDVAAGANSTPLRPLSHVSGRGGGPRRANHELIAEVALA